MPLRTSVIQGEVIISMLTDTWEKLTPTLLEDLEGFETSVGMWWESERTRVRSGA